MSQDRGLRNGGELAKVTKPAREDVDAVRADVWEAALRAAGGNLTAASQSLSFSPQRGHALTKRHGLLELAEQLREENGQPARGRPRR